MIVEYFYQISNFSIYFIFQFGYVFIDFVYVIFCVVNFCLNFVEFIMNDGGFFVDFYIVFVGYFLNVVCGMVFFVDDVIEVVYVVVIFWVIKFDIF